jgi:MYXO-CTERM domain-containing protein
MPVLRDILAGAALLSALAPALASAGDLGVAGTPLIHKGQTCLTLVDRAQDPVVHLGYTIPNNDLCLTEDEPADGRTHQFIAFCRDEPAAYRLPAWLTWSEVQVNIDAGRVPADAIPQTDVLESNPRHDGCWRRITADADRRPISCAAARPGVDWDTSDLAPGAYVVAGYTYDPPLHAWSRRRGAFKIFDGDRDAAPPAVAIATAEAFPWKNQSVRLGVCADAQDGSTITASWAKSAADPVWTVFLADEPVPGATFEIDFLPPPEQAGVELTVRVEIEDPLGRVAVAHMAGEVLSQTIEDPNAGESSTTDASDTGIADEPFDFCRDNPKADDLPPCATPGPSEPTEPTGCGCASTSGSPWLALVLLLLRARRRR